MASKKTLEQKLALAQDRLSKLKKEASQKERKAREHKKFTVGGEVTRVFGLDYDLALVVGFLEHFNKLSDEQKQALKSNGERLLKSRLENAEK
jgi:high-affinity Fe2+/Pb2+ permease